jgi:hypothetical protein
MAGWGCRLNANRSAVVNGIYDVALVEERHGWILVSEAKLVLVLPESGFVPSEGVTQVAPSEDVLVSAPSEDVLVVAAPSEDVLVSAPSEDVFVAAPSEDVIVVAPSEDG